LAGRIYVPRLGYVEIHTGLLHVYLQR